MLTMGFFALVGNLTEYRIGGRLVGQGLGFMRGDTYTICMYGALEEAAHIGLWFYNVAEHIRHALAMRAAFVNGTLDVHKLEAKLHAGLVLTREEALVSRLYGGHFSHIPRERAR